MNQRQHELETNALAVAIGKLDKAIQPYKQIIAVFVGAVLIGGLAIAFYSTQASESRSDATLQLIQADNDPEVLASVSSNHPGTIAAQWAKLYQGNEYLGEGLQALYQNRENSLQLLEDAKAAFSSALVDNDDPLLDSRAHFGLARTHESLGDLDLALAEYEKTVAVHESDAMVKLAGRRIERLNSPATKDFLAWFADQDFAPAGPSMPPALPGSSSLPDLPDLELPTLELPNLELPGLGIPGGENSDVMEKEDGLALPDEETLEKSESMKSEHQGSADQAKPEPTTKTPPVEAPISEGSSDNGGE